VALIFDFKKEYLNKPSFLLGYQTKDTCVLCEEGIQTSHTSFFPSLVFESCFAALSVFEGTPQKRETQLLVFLQKILIAQGCEAASRKGHYQDCHHLPYFFF